MKTRALYKIGDIHNLIWFQSKGRKFPKRFYFYFSQSKEIASDLSFQSGKTYYIDPYGEVANPTKIPVSSKRQYDIGDLKEEDFIKIYEDDGTVTTDTTFDSTKHYYYDHTHTEEVTPNNLGLYAQITAYEIKYEDFQPMNSNGVIKYYETLNQIQIVNVLIVTSIKIYETENIEDSYCEITYTVEQDASTDLSLIILNDEMNFYQTYTYHISASETLNIPFNKFAVAKKVKDEELIEGNFSIKQRGVADNLTQRLSVLKGELWWQINHGIPLLDKIKNRTIYDSVIINIVLSNRDVRNIVKYESKVENHTYKFSMIVDTVFNETIEFSNVLRF